MDGEGSNATGTPQSIGQTSTVPPKSTAEGLASKEVGSDPFMTRAWGRGMIGAAAVLWSLSGAFTKSIAIEDGVSIAFYRGLFAGIALVLVVPRHRMRFRPTMIPMILTFGAMSGLFIAATIATTAANAIFLQCSATIWVVPLGIVLLKEQPSRQTLMGIAIAGLGIALILGFGFESVLEAVPGITLGLSSGIAYALIIIGLRSFQDLDPLWLSAVNNLGGAILLLLWSFLMGGMVIIPTVEQAMTLFLFGVIQMAIPYALFARGLRTVPAAEAGLLTLVEPVLSPVWTYLAVGEIPRPMSLVGGALLICGVATQFVPRVVSRNRIKRST